MVNRFKSAKLYSGVFRNSYDSYTSSNLVNPVFHPHDDNEYGLPNHEQQITQAQWDVAWVDNERVRAMSKEEFAALLRQSAHLVEPIIKPHRLHDKLAKYFKIRSCWRYPWA